MTGEEIKNITIPGEQIREVFETHISWVLLTDVHAYKIKKPVKFSFLDFSTLDKRKYFCERELFLNSRLTSGMYLSVVELCKDHEGIVIENGYSKVVDYAVKMIRQDLNKQMHRKLEKKNVKPAHVISIAEKVAAFHLSQEAIHKPYDLQSNRSRFNNLLDIVSIVKEYLGSEYSNIIEFAVTFSDVFLEEHSNWFEDRVERGMVRDCHGDLHSGNIFLYDDPVIFDCIEFNDEFRQIDVLSEIAFFCMDMDVFDKERFSRVFLKKYSELFPEAIGGDDDWQIFNYYKIYRANVRAKVNGLKILPGMEAKELKGSLNEVKVYLNLMKKYLDSYPKTVGE